MPEPPAATSPDRSYWRATAPSLDLAPLTGAVDVDVAVVGAGIFGLSTAVLAAEAGRSVTVLEAREVCSGTTGGTTGKVTVQNGTRLAQLRERAGIDVARRYAAANLRGIALLDRLVADHDIAADLEVAPAHLVSLDPSADAQVTAEAAATREVGVPVEVDAAFDELDFPVRTALTVPDQRQIHAVRHCHGLVAAVQRLGGTVHGRSRVVDLEASRGSRRWRLATDRGEVHADHVVLATRLPTHRDARLTFGRTKPVSAVGLAARLDGAAPRGMYLFEASRTWSIRSSRTPDAGEHLVAVGVSEPTGSPAALGHRGRTLTRWVEERFPTREVDHVWMAQDQVPADGRPFVGPLWGEGTWTATGFGKWGLAFGIAAAEAVVAGIAGQPDPYEGAFATGRVEPPGGWQELLRANLRVGGLFVGDRVRALPSGVEDLATGEGRVVRVGRTPVAVSRGEDGALHAVSATCTHLGCLVRWNRQEHTWDCGCHGSRFAADGEVLEAPATAPLRPIDLDG